MLENVQYLFSWGRKYKRKDMEKIYVFTLSSQVSNIFLTQTLKRELSAANVYEKNIVT